MMEICDQCALLLWESETVRQTKGVLCVNFKEATTLIRDLGKNFLIIKIQQSLSTFSVFKYQLLRFLWLLQTFHKGAILARVI